MASRTIGAVAALLVFAGPAFSEDYVSLPRQVAQSGLVQGAERDYWTEASALEAGRRALQAKLEQATPPSMRWQDNPAHDVGLEPPASPGRWQDDPGHDVGLMTAVEAQLKQERAGRPAADAQYERQLGSLSDDDLMLSEPAKTRVRAQAQLVRSELRTAQVFERWNRVVVNDPSDVAAARLEDLARRQAELEAGLDPAASAADFRTLIEEMQAIDQELDILLDQLAGEMWRRRSGHRNTCFPPPVPDRPVAIFNCHYLAQGLPRTFNTGGGRIILDAVRLDVEEDLAGVPVSLSVGYFWRYAGESARDEPSSGQAGEIRYGPGGRARFVVSDVDDNGNPREATYPMTLSTGKASITLPGFSDTGPLQLSFERDPANYVSWDVYQRSARGDAPQGIGRATGRLPTTVVMPGQRRPNGGGGGD